MLSIITSQEASEVFSIAHKKKLINEEDSSVVFYSLDILHERLDHLLNIFPASTLHAIAIKTNPLKKVLQSIVDYGFGLEAASWEELRLAHNCNIPGDRVVFDSPAKTQREINACITTYPATIINANCMEELLRYPNKEELHLGLRINPLIRTDSPAIFNVSQTNSKFGVPISRRGEIIDIALKPPYITGLHMHSGSDMHDFEENVCAVANLKILADEINIQREAKKIPARIEYLDIGGGISASLPSLTPYVNRILEVCPDLFQEYKVITEFGKFIHQETAFVVSDIEYILPAEDGSSDTAVVHVGADMFVRQVYSSHKTDYAISVFDRNGKVKETGNRLLYNIAGPLCFSGDYLYKNYPLPSLQSGEKLCIHSVGANTTGLWSRHCSRDVPKTIGYSLENNYFQIFNERTSFII